MRKFVVGASIVALAAAAQSAAAQTTIGWDASVFSSYDWRGTRLTNKPVFEPDVYVTFPIGRGLPHRSAAGPTSTSASTTSPSDISESGGTSAFNFAEFDPWAEVGVSGRQGHAHAAGHRIHLSQL